MPPNIYTCTKCRIQKEFGEALWHKNKSYCCFCYDKLKKTKMENKQCQYNYPNCQQQATYQNIIKLGSVKIDKKWACGNCKEYIEKTQKLT